ncbi:M6 family metalloprotease domain-containing protein [Streptomyces ureilyticus]|uniref:M6 family metalloprotease domain-containing protein n=1 Tax=Streptomyces ureilyticus TaxID=1775131 RepID=A0ABX0DLJ7_9ACTN|nr:M6 family metalloprotease domain-containing protein [Streptomyces ureilyticus]NGO41183.1 M6 family metalloprotease domain-containing protein [Streptomyces ureilyticus]
MQPASRRIRSCRRAATLASMTLLTLVVSTSADSGRLPAGSATAAGPVATARPAALGPCRLSGAVDVQLSEGIPTPPGYARSTGTVRALNLMVDFSDAPGRGSALDRYREFFPQTTRWFRTSSYGRLDYRPVAPVRDWLRMPKPFKAYGIERGAPFDPAYRKLVEDLVAVADPMVDFKAYDLLNVLVTPNAGPSALDTVLSVTFAGNAEAPVADGVPVANASFIYSRQDDGSGSYGKTGYRVLPHENGHVFGLPDLYTRDGGGAVGHWDIMSEDWGAGNDLLAWHKWKLGWLDDAQVACVAAPGSTEHVLTPLPERGGDKLVFLPIGAKRGYAVELRTPGGNDEDVCKPGVLVYKVDADVDTGHGPIHVVDATKDSGGCTPGPNVHAELSDAAFGPGRQFKDVREGIRIRVGEADGDGNQRVYVTRR